MPSIFLDESGGFSKESGDKHFVIGSFTVGTPRRTEKEFIKWHRRKAPRKMRPLAEWKYADAVNDDLKLGTLRFISQLDIRARFVYLQTANIPDGFRHKERILTGDLYTAIVGETIEKYLPITDLELRVFCDQRHLKGINRAEFKRRLIARLRPQVPSAAKIQIEMIDSTSNRNIQIADWISGAFFARLENRPLGVRCYQILKDNILSEDELFKDYWVDEYAKQKSGS